MRREALLTRAEELAAMEAGLDHVHIVYHINLCDKSWTDPRGEHSDVVILLQEPIHKDGIAHWLLSPRRGSSRNTAGAICKGVGKETSISAGNIHLDLN